MPFLKDVRNIQLPLKYSQFTVLMQNQLKSDSFVGKKGGVIA